jgi:hypothetical protein
MHAQTSAGGADGDAGVTVAEEWVGRALILRGFPAGDELKYDAAGRPGQEKSTDWTLAGFELQKVSRRGDGELQLDGVRVAIRFNPDQHAFERHVEKAEPVRVLLPDESGQQVAAALPAIFSQGIDPALQRSMPAYWSHFFIPGLAWDDAMAGQTVLGAGAKVPDGVVFPVAEKKPEPGLTPEATLDHVKGTLQLQVDVDAAGEPRRIVVRQPLGYGLDAKTVEALGKFRFRPGMLNGAPVAVRMVVKQGFD